MAHAGYCFGKDSTAVFIHLKMRIDKATDWRSVRHLKKGISSILIDGESKMKKSIQHLIVIQAAIVTFLLAGCSNENAAKGPTVRDTLTEIISASEMSDYDSIDEEPSPTQEDRDNINSSVVRSPSSKMLHKPVKEPAVQKVQGYALRATNAIDIESTPEPPSKEQVTKKRKKSNRVPQSHHTVLIGDALKDVLGGREATSESTVRDTLAEIIPAGETSNEDHMNNELRE